MGTKKESKDQILAVRNVPWLVDGLICGLIALYMHNT